jgi:hypothetical protein
MRKLRTNASWLSIANYLKELWNSKYNYHIDDCPLDIEMIPMDVRVILRHNSDVIWSYNERQNVKWSDRELSAKLWDTYVPNNYYN